MLSEKVELLGGSVYGAEIPKVITLQSIPTSVELDYVSAEDFDAALLDRILPAACEEKINFRKLLEIDFDWVCRCLRLLNYGPYFTTNTVYCEHCGKVTGEAMMDLRAVNCVPLPEGFVNDIVIPKDRFVDYKYDIHVKLLTIQERIDANNDKLFANSEGEVNKELARMAYMIKQVKPDKKVTSVEAKLFIETEISPADYIILKDEIRIATNYGLRAGGSVRCPKCNGEATFIALADDRFLHPTVGDIRKGRNDRCIRPKENVAGSTSETV